MDAGNREATSVDAYAANRSALVNLLHSAQSLLEHLSRCCPIAYPFKEERSIEQYPMTVLGLAVDAFTLSPLHLGSLVGLKIRDASAHLDKLMVRVLDVKSRVLVTGDVNAGKSTFVNAVLGRIVVCDDQQPCTNVFAEVVDADQNGGAEEVHGIRFTATYDKLKEATFDRIQLAELREHIEDNPCGYTLLKVYCRDCRTRDESLLKNGLVDVSLVDSPGLNISTINTMSLFAKQEEIDVVVFVVNSENHFTLSGREFLEIAGREKAYIFFVCNKYDLIQRQERCQVEILNQIKIISPTTYRDADKLVHFVSARDAIADCHNPTFSKLEGDLRAFILTRRTLSKLLPIKTYIQTLLQDVSSLAAFNSKRIQASLQGLEVIQRKNGPIYDALVRIRESVVCDTDARIAEQCEGLGERLRPCLNGFISKLGVFVERSSFSMGYSGRVKGLLRNLASAKMQKCRAVAEEELLENVGELETTAFRYFDRGTRLLDDLAVKNAFEEGEVLELPAKLWRWRNVLGGVGVGSIVFIGGVLGFIYADFRVKGIESQDLFLSLSSIGNYKLLLLMSRVQCSCVWASDDETRHPASDHTNSYFTSRKFEIYHADNRPILQGLQALNAQCLLGVLEGVWVSKIRDDVGIDVDKIKLSETTWAGLSRDCSVLFTTVNRLKM